MFVFLLTVCGCSDDGTPNLDSPCAKPLPPKVLRVSLKDWKNGEHFLKWGKASVFLATTTEISSYQLETIHSKVHSQGTNDQHSDQGAIYDRIGHAGEVGRPGPSDTARFTFKSPWPSVLIELLSGEHIRPSESWIYPFKHIVTYEEQIRKCAELLNETDVDNVEAKHFSHNLGTIVSEVVHLLGPRREDVEYSDTYISSVLQKAETLDNHHAKVKKSSPDEFIYDSDDDNEAEPGLSGMSSGNHSGTEISKRSNIEPETNTVAKEHLYMCTCLRDARDHLQLFISAIDWHLGSLLKLRKTIRNGAAAKIRFEHLWHLFRAGDLVVTSRQPHQAYRVIHVGGGRPLLTTEDLASRDKEAEGRPVFHRQSQVSPFTIDCVRFDFDGEKFGPVQDTISILEYEDDTVITTLDVYPINYAEKEEELTQSLLNRGRRFAEYYEFKHKRYEGLSLSEPQEEVSRLLGYTRYIMLIIDDWAKIESEVIIDFTQSYRQPDNANQKPQIGLRGVTKADEREVYQDRCTPDGARQCLRWDHNALIDDTEFDKRQTDRFLNVGSHGMFLESRGGPQTLNDDQLLLLPFRVQGFSLRTRKWGASKINISI